MKYKCFNTFNSIAEQKHYLITSLSHCHTKTFGGFNQENLPDPSDYTFQIPFQLRQRKRGISSWQNSL